MFTHMADEFFDKVHFTSTLISVVGVPAATFRAWRNRNGLFPATSVSEGWNEFSIADICVARQVKILIDRGFTAQAAVDQAQLLKEGIDGYLKIAQSEKPPTKQFGIALIDAFDGEWSVLYPDLNGSWLSSIVSRVAQGTCVVIFINDLVIEVTNKIIDLEPDRLTSKDELRQILLEVQAKVWNPEND